MFLWGVCKNGRSISSAPFKWDGLFDRGFLLVWIYLFVELVTAPDPWVAIHSSVSTKLINLDGHLESSAWNSSATEMDDGHVIDIFGTGIGLVLRINWIHTLMVSSNAFSGL